MSLPNYYMVLGVTSSCSSVELKKAYRALSLVRHPDKNPNDPKATANFQLLNEAYQTLSDGVKRCTYDYKFRTQLGSFSNAQYSSSSCSYFYAPRDVPRPPPNPYKQPKPRSQYPNSQDNTKGQQQPDGDPRQNRQNPFGNKYRSESWFKEEQEAQRRRQDPEFLSTKENRKTKQAWRLDMYIKIQQEQFSTY